MFYALYELLRFYNVFITLFNTHGIPESINLILYQGCANTNKYKTKIANIYYIDRIILCVPSNFYVFIIKNTQSYMHGSSSVLQTIISYMQQILELNHCFCYLPLRSFNVYLLLLIFIETMASGRAIQLNEDRSQLRAFIQQN